jgi:hypothetical protein
MGTDLAAVNSRIRRGLRSVVIIDARDHSGNRIGLRCARFNGNIDEMARAADHLRSEAGTCCRGMSGIQSRTYAVGRDGKVFVISPNGLHVSELGTKDAAYTLGDLSARVD